MNKKKRFFGIALSVLMVFCMLPTAIPAYAADNFISIEDDSGDKSGSGWVYTAANHTLKLNNYSGQYIE